VKKAQLANYVDRWEGKGALYVVAHARRQRTRGKNPSEPYRDHRNPRRALEAARKDLEIYEAMAGDYIPMAIVRMLAIAKLAEQSVRGTFNGVEIIATPTSLSATLVNQFHAEQERQGEEYRKSPEYARVQREQAERMTMLQQKADALMEQLSTLDFSNQTALLDWVAEMEEPRDHVGVRVDGELLVRTFEAHGYVAGANCGDEFKEHDADNFARWIIGQALESSYPMVSHFAKEWKERFLPPPTEELPTAPGVH